MTDSVSALDELKLASISRLAHIFEVHRDTVTARLRSAGLDPVKSEGRSLKYPIKAAATAILLNGNAGTNDPDGMTAHERRAWYQSENERVRLEKELQHLLVDSDVAREWGKAFRAMASMLDSLPDVLERECSLDPVALAVVEKQVDAQREQLYEDVVRD